MAEGRVWSGAWARRFEALGAAGVLGFVSGCGARDPAALPPAAPSAWTVVASRPSAAPEALGTRRWLEDRALGRSGLACGDCHAVSASGLRTSPRLDGAAARGSLWSGATTDLPIAVNLCVERYLDRPALTPPALDALVSAVASLPTQVGGGLGPGHVDGALLYDAACRHCHEDGPAGPVLTTRWPRRQLVDVIRGQDRPAHPATHMPAFTTETLPDAALDVLVEFIADAPTRAR